MAKELSGELEYRIRYDVEHDLFHVQNIFSEEYIYHQLLLSIFKNLKKKTKS